MGQPIENLVIVGGGTAGWLSATYLQRALPQNVKITLVESQDVPTVGVGESTYPTLVETVKFLGLDETEFLREAHGTYKAAIRFDGWEHNPGTTKRNYWYHPFFSREGGMLNPYKHPYFPYLGQGYSMTHYWLDAYKKNEKEIGDFDYSCYLGPHFCDINKAPKGEGQAKDLRYAYHIDAGRFADYMKKIGKQRGINHIVGHVKNITRNSKGFIEDLHLADGRIIKGDFYIDCTGFASVLLGKTLGEKFLSDEKSLFCNRAVAIQDSNNPEKEGVRSFTTSTAQDAGWIWEVPLFNRNGTGYVYCDKFISPEDAEKNLRSHLGDSCPDHHQANHLRMRVGRMENFWSHNCVGIGLSGSFLEPLEATSILFTELQLANLVSLFPHKDFSPYRMQKYNEVMNKFYTEIRDFVILHYYLSRRDDTPFWKAVREETYLPDSVKVKLELQKENFTILDQLEFQIFSAQSYHCLFAGMNHLPKANYPVLDYVDNYEMGRESLDRMKKDFPQIAKEMPDHYQYLKENIFNEASFS